MLELIGMFSMVTKVGYLILAIITITFLSIQVYRWLYSWSQQDRDDGKKMFFRILIGSIIIAILPLLYYGVVDKSKLNEYQAKGTSRLMNDLKSRANDINSSTPSGSTSSSSNDLFGN